MPSGIIFDIAHFALQDGPGIRTAVFMKGCPLHCAWCHNPESQKFTPEVSFIKNKCINCQRCAAVCPQQCHRFDSDGNHIFDRSHCHECLLCTVGCPTKSLTPIGTVMTVDQVIAEVIKDRVIYEHSQGGLTISGGEPMAQFDFVLALAQAAKQHQIHVCLDTSGAADTEKYLKIAPWIDLFLYDLKGDNATVKRLTGADQRVILKNLHALDHAGAQISLRCPLVAAVNDSPEHLKQIAEAANSLENIQHIYLEPYHPLWQSKNANLGYADVFDHHDFTSSELMESYKAVINAQTHVKCIISQ